ncbi:bifunctional oligoribonuclease/PAP phosphatase NrnA [Clostridium sp. YIM B02551]|uniref:DHH family phosphoesterase n=1 Tax=Clostridium sp. YIM B02551 TaxID=2910679 RepID=UPI001EEBED4A|nr:DHH family phosphoesterase [Clostridium sp. YIM B02551]
MSKLNKLIEKLKNKEVFIQTHNNPDPDAIASSFALKKLLKSKGIEATFYCTGEIERYSTKKMIELLNINIEYINTIDNLNKDMVIIVVDAQKNNKNVSDISCEKVACIDHHPIFVEEKYIFEDIRDEYGACSSIIAEYYFENNVEMDINVATALLYGIKMDTLDLSRGASEKDIEYYCFLYKKANINILNKILRNNLEIKEIAAYSNAIESIRVFEGIGFADAGANCTDSLLACISDFMLSIKEIDFAVVYSKREKDYKFSIRNEMDELDAGKIVNNALSGIGNGGGHKEMAGGLISLDKTKDIVISTEDAIINKFLKSIKEYRNIL